MLKDICIQASDRCMRKNVKPDSYWLFLHQFLALSVYLHLQQIFAWSFRIQSFFSFFVNFVAHIYFLLFICESIVKVCHSQMSQRRPVYKSALANTSHISVCLLCSNSGFSFCHSYFCHDYFYWVHYFDTERSICCCYFWRIHNATNNWLKWMNSLLFLLFIWVIFRFFLCLDFVLWIIKKKKIARNNYFFNSTTKDIPNSAV